MSWSVYDGPLEFRVGPSRSLGSWLALGHLLAAAALLYADLPAVGLAIVALSLCVALRRASAPLGIEVRAIGWSAADGWTRIGISHDPRPMELRPSSVVTTCAMFLHWDDGISTWRVVLPRDAMHPEDWRRMTVIARLYEGQDRMLTAAVIATPAGRTSRTAPGLPEWRMDSPGFRGACPNGHEEQRPVAGRESPAR